MPTKPSMYQVGYSIMINHNRSRKIEFDWWLWNLESYLISLAPRFIICKMRIIVLYSFPRVAITNYHKLSGLKQQKFIVLQFWRPEIQNQGIGRAMLPLKSLGENPSLPLPASLGPGYFLACGCKTPFSAFVFTWTSRGLHSSLSLLLPLCLSWCFSYKDTCHWI